MKCITRLPLSLSVGVLFLLIAFPATAQTTHFVDQVGITFVPQHITVLPGDTVQWDWSGGNHTVTSGAACAQDFLFFDVPLDGGSPTFSFLIPNDGTTFIPYFCVPHCGDGMTGTITVDICGDGVVGSTEECDDNNTANGDGCSDGCRWEAFIELIPLSVAGGSDVTMALPDPLAKVAIGDSFVVEIWLQTDYVSGFSSGGLDVSYDPAMVDVTGVAVTPLFPLIQSGADNDAGLVDDVAGGVSLLPDPCAVQMVGSSPNWARLAVLDIDATSVPGGFATIAGVFNAGVFTTALCGLSPANRTMSEIFFSDAVVEINGCDDGNPCTVDTFDGVCVNTPLGDGAACDNGTFCDGTEECQANVCTNSTGDPCPGPDGDNDCAESCDEGTDSCTADDSNGSACDNGTFCDGSETCTAGVCGDSTGDPCDGPDGDDDCSEVCDEGNDNCNAPDPNGSPCDDGLFCTTTSSCSGGVCVGSGDPCPGADGDGDCSEACNEGANNCTANDPNGSACDDSQFCTVTDACAAGACVGTGNPCPGPNGDDNCAESCNEGANDCTANDPNGSPCNDGEFCTETDTCSGGNCTGAGDPCPGPDGDGDCSETCDEVADDCDANDTDGSACDNGSFCDGTEMCTSGACGSSTGDPCPGPDGDIDCSETCNEGANNCTVNDPNGTVCDDLLFCTGADTCSGGSCSIHTGNACSGPDGDIDCSESCNEGANDCTANDPNGSACDDGFFCTDTDTCSVGNCMGAGDPCPGPDGDADCFETCDDDADDCFAADPIGSACSNGAFCDGTETCDNVGACANSTGDPCTGPDGDGNCSESCNEGADNCTAADPDASPCNDGVFCNGTDACDVGLCSSHSGNPCPDGGAGDGDDDCSESCNEGADNCTAADNNGAVCDDNVFCNGAGDTCSGGNCSVHTGDPCVGPDGDGDCQESCDEGAGDCFGDDANGVACDDGEFCTGTDTCVSGFCDGHTGDPCPDGDAGDGDNDCAESCDEVFDDCGGDDFDGADCDDLMLCTDPAMCLSGLCVPGPDDCTDDCEICEEAADDCAWCIFDVDFDGLIGFGDFGTFAGCFGLCTPACAFLNWDQSPDGCIGTGDFAPFAGCFGLFCGQCPTCFFGINPSSAGLQAWPQGFVSLELRATPQPSRSDFAEQLPRDQGSFRVGDSFYLEVWAGRASIESGLASAYVDLAFDRSMLVVEEVIPSAAFSVLTGGDVDGRRGVIRALGGSVLGETGLGLDSEWVRVATVKVRGLASGRASALLDSAGEVRGVSVNGSFGNLDPSAIDYGATVFYLDKATTGRGRSGSLGRRR